MRIGGRGGAHFPGANFHEEPVELGGDAAAAGDHRDVALGGEVPPPLGHGGGGCPALGGLGAPFLISATVRWMCEAQKASKAPPRASMPSTRALKGAAGTGQRDQAPGRRCRRCGSGQAHAG